MYKEIGYVMSHMRLAHTKSKFSIFLIPLIIVGLILASVDLFPVQAAEEDEPVFVGNFGGSGTDDGLFNNPLGMTSDSVGNIYVIDSGNHRVQKFDSGGIFLSSWGSMGMGDEDFILPVEIEIDTSGDLIIGHAFGLKKFTDQGAFIESINELYPPTRFTLNSSDEIFLTLIDTDCVRKLSSDGTMLTSWGSWGTGQGEFFDPRGVSTDPDGNVYVADVYNERIQKFTGDGTYVTEWDGGLEGAIDGLPEDVEYDSSNDRLFVANTYSHNILVFDPVGNFLFSWGEQGTGDGQLNQPTGIALLPDDRIAIANRVTDRIEVFQFDVQPPAGTLSTISDYDTDTGEITISGIASDGLTAISAVEYTVWPAQESRSACTADDGTFDELVEEFTCTAAAELEEGSYVLNVTGRDSKDNESLILQQEFEVHADNEPVVNDPPAQQLPETGSGVWIFYMAVLPIGYLLFNKQFSE